MAGIQSIKTAVVAPVFNEADTWRSIVTDLALLFDLVVVVDDGSEVALQHPQTEGVVLLRHDKNMGKGAALRSGFRYCLDHHALVIGTIDTDGEHDPRNFMHALARYNGEDLVSLSRAPHFHKYGWLRRIRNQVFSKLVSNRIGVQIGDTQSGMRIFSDRAVRACMKTELPSGYAVETIMLETVVQEDLQVSEQAMAYAGLIRNGKKYSDLGVLRADFCAFLARVFLPKRRADTPRPPQQNQNAPATRVTAFEHKI